MSYRRSADQVRDDLAWARFADAHRSQAGAAGLPLMALESQAHFEDLLMHGYFDHHRDSSGFSVAQLSKAQYQEFLSLAENYFAAGYAWFTPMAFLELDRQLLQSRFENRA